ncbi:MAG: hypothetical protein ACTH9T_04805 [Mycetocola reblochoni]|uniref:hypothetical protein n=1 Tax=Mycetocola reblochoni TaxID=331618 RepID=UPI003F9D550F
MIIDGNGVLLYEETDREATFSDLLNVGQEQTSATVGAILARLSALETRNWANYTPALTSSDGSTNPNVGAGAVRSGRFKRDGNVVYGYARVTLGSSGVNAGTGSYFISLPVAPRAFTGMEQVIGGAYFWDGSASRRYTGISRLSSGDDARARIISAAGAMVGATAPFVPATGDAFSINFMYEV